MAIYHLHAKVIGRSGGQSAVAAAAYRAGEKLHDLRTGKTHDYRRKVDVVHKEIIARDGVAHWVFTREVLWNRVESGEKRKDSQLAREIEVSLPRELSRERQIQLVREFVKTEFVSKGMIADVAIHNPTASDGYENPHAHIMLTMRHLEEWEFSDKKARKWNAGFANNKGKGEKGFVKDKSGLLLLRARWTEACNQALSEADSEARIDHRSYKERGINWEPQPKLGKTHHMVRRDAPGSKRLELPEQLKQLTFRNTRRHMQNRNATGKPRQEYEQLRQHRKEQTKIRQQLTLDLQPMHNDWPPPWEHGR